MKKIIAMTLFLFSTSLVMSQNRVLDTLTFFRGGMMYKVNIHGDTLKINDTAFIGFPGFGPGHDHAAYGDHVHPAQAVNSCEIQSAADAANAWSMPFVLKSTSVVFFNSTPLRATQWSGVGLNTLTVALDVRKYDQIFIIN